MKVMLAAAAVTLGLSSPALAADTAIIGLAGNTCGDWQQTHYESLEYRDWIWGYISGAVYRGHDDNLVRSSSPFAMIAWLKTYCDAHPLDNLAMASNALLSELRKRQSSN